MMSPGSVFGTSPGLRGFFLSCSTRIHFVGSLGTICPGLYLGFPFPFAGDKGFVPFSFAMMYNPMRFPSSRSKQGKTMKDAALPVVLAVLIVVVATCLAILTTRQEALREDTTALETTPKLLAADPTFFTGRLVKVKTAGMERLSPSELMYRAIAGQPPIAVLRLRNPLKPTDTTPAFLVGVCVGRVEEGHVLVVDCR